jgi:hypothetical protein
VRYVVTDEALSAPYRAVRRQGVAATLYELDAPSPPVRVELAAGGSGRVVAGRERVSRMEATVEADGPGLLVWSRTAHPAWRATVDGSPTAIVAVSDHLVGVPLSGGAHRVHVWWPAGPVVIGGVLGVAGLLITAALFWRRQ